MSSSLNTDRPREGIEAERAPTGQTLLLMMIVAGGILLGRVAGLVPDSPAFQTWMTMFVAIVVQSMPFLLLGVLAATGIAVLMSEAFVRRLFPSRQVLAVPVASVAGIGLVGCECASVPIARGAIRKGVGAPAAMAFLLAAPAVNPVVIVSTLVAFPGMPQMAVARFVGSFLVSVLVGWLWIRLGRGVKLTQRAAELEHTHKGGWSGFLASVHHDLITTAGYLVLGAMIAAGVNAFVPRSALDALGSQAVLGILVMAAMAFIVALCSQTDAFIAASMTAFSPTAHLVFLVVGPAMDIKLAILEAGVFGRQFAARFIPLVIMVAVVVACALGWVLL